jgi:hypothetical protein
MATFRFDNGVLADIWLTYEIPPGLGSALQFLVVGSKGMVDFGRMVRCGSQTAARTAGDRV